MENHLMMTLYGLTAILWSWALVDLLRSRSSKGSIKGLWLLVIILFPILGSIAYFQMGRQHLYQEKRKFNPAFNKDQRIARLKVATYNRK